MVTEHRRAYMKVYNKKYKQTEKYKRYKEKRKASGKDLIVSRARAYWKTERGRQNWRNYHKTEKYKTYEKNYSRKLKLKALEKLGNKCCNPKCAVPGGMTDWRSLQIDHINGGGTKESREIGNKAIYRKIVNGAQGYQLLCANCNWIKRFENNENPNLKKEKG